MKSYQTAAGYAVPAGTTAEYFYQVKDWLGTPHITLDALGAVKNAVDYYPYGKAMPNRSAYGTNYEGYRYQYTGHEKDGETGYQYHGARYYDEDLARYLSVDPLAMQFHAWSTYNYVMGNPLSLTDETGLAPTPPKNIHYYNMVKQSDGSYTANHSYNSSNLLIKSSNATFVNSQTHESRTLVSAAHGAQKFTTNVYTYWNSDGTIDRQVATSKDLSSVNSLQWQVNFQDWNQKQAQIGWENATPQQRQESENIQSVLQPLRDYSIEAIKPAAELFTLYSNLGGQGSSGISNSAKILGAEAPLSVEELLKLNNNRNSVTIETATQKIRYDLAGKAHGNVPTPHKQIYNKNFVNGEVKSITRASKEAFPINRRDRKTVTDFLKK